MSGALWKMPASPWGTGMPSNLVKLTVLLTPEEARRLDAFCEQSGHKKSTLVARLIRDHLNKQNAPYVDVSTSSRRPGDD